MYLIIYFLALVAAVSAKETVVLSDVDACQHLLRQNSMLNENDTVRALNGIVGVGWDDLMNRATIPILNNKYTTCKRVQDGSFFVPDDVMVIPILQTSLDRMANVYTSYKSYLKQTTDTITASVSGHYGGFGVSGSFSSTHQETKNTFFRQKSTMLHSKMIYHAYRLITDGSTGLHAGFVARLQQIIDAVEIGVQAQAKRLAELIIRDYGTHVVFKADVGAVIEQETYIDSKTDYSSVTTMDSLRASASASFLSLGHASVDTAHTVTETDKQILSNMTHHSRIRSRGGPNVNRLSDAKGIFTIDEVVAFSNEGMPLDALITTANLPMWDTGRIYTVQELIRNATEEYYERNTIRGCTDILSPNFNYQANFDDDSCEAPNTTYSFNGVFQKCKPLTEASGSYELTTTPKWRCDDIIQENPMTNAFTCQENYEPVLITSIVHQFPDRTEQRSYQKCHHHWFKKKCHTVDYTVIMKDRVQIDSFWCREKSGATLPPNSGALFGGLYTKNSINIFTGSASCPGTYTGYHLFFDLTVCISYDYQMDSEFAIPFNGFFSCQSTLMKCDGNYTQHLVEIFDNCAVFYCVSPEAYLSLEDPVIKRPPFTDAALAKSNYSESTVVAFYRDEESVHMPVLDVMQKHIKEMESKMKKDIPIKISLTVSDVEDAIENYMNSTSEQMLTLIEEYPDKTWGEIINLLSSQNISDSDLF